MVEEWNQSVSKELQGMYAEPVLVEAISGKLRPPPLSRMKIVYLRNLVAFILSLPAYDKGASHSHLSIYISDGIPERISFESVDGSRSSSDLEIL